jgi:ABC-type multidrug transport system fused ATPase/permease subunit
VERLTCVHRADAADSVGIRDISFSLRRGQLTVVTGAVGSGKTTLLRAILGLLDVQGGALYWNETHIDTPGEFMVPPRCAYTPQMPVLISATIRENLLLGLSPRPATLDQAIWHAVFEQDLADMPNGLDTEIGTRGLRLSGGQAQRTAAARMFLRQPQLYVFDDLSSALDVSTERLLWERLMTGDAPPTCLAVSHRRAVLKRADQVIVLQNGRLADCGPLRDLLKRCDEMQHLWHASAE